MKKHVGILLVGSMLIPLCGCTLQQILICAAGAGAIVSGIWTIFNVL